jgi:hypothetical protein
MKPDSTEPLYFLAVVASNSIPNLFPKVFALKIVFSVCASTVPALVVDYPI